MQMKGYVRFKCVFSFNTNIKIIEEKRYLFLGEKCGKRIIFSRLKI